MQVLKGVRMRMQRTVRVLYMIHCTFRDGFQVHHHPSAKGPSARPSRDSQLALSATTVHSCASLCSQGRTSCVVFDIGGAVGVQVGRDWGM